MTPFSRQSVYSARKKWVIRAVWIRWPRACCRFVLARRLSSHNFCWTLTKILGANWLGVTTETGDADGEVISEADASGVTAAQVVEALKTFVGEIEQIPSMYSALKHQGQPLYKLARQGIEVERAPRKVTIYSAEMLNITGSEIELLVHCSKCTYIRSLAEDLGAALVCGGHVSGLRRLAAGQYQEEQSVSFEQLKAIGSPEELDALLLPVSSAVGTWPVMRLHEDTAHYLLRGQPVQVAHAPTKGWVQIFESGEEDRFLGVGEILTDGRIAPRRLVASG